MSQPGRVAKDAAWRPLGFATKQPLSPAAKRCLTADAVVRCAAAELTRRRQRRPQHSERGGALPPLERRFRNEGTHDRLTQANKLERQHGRTSRRRQRRGPRRPRRLRKRQRRQRPGPRARARARPWWRRVRTRADIIVALTVAIDATHRPWSSTTRRYIERHRHDANWLISTQ